MKTAEGPRWTVENVQAIYLCFLVYGSKKISLILAHWIINQLYAVTTLVCLHLLKAGVSVTKRHPSLLSDAQFQPESRCWTKMRHFEEALSGAVLRNLRLLWEEFTFSLLRRVDALLSDCSSQIQACVVVLCSRCKPLLTAHKCGRVGLGFSGRALRGHPTHTRPHSNSVM